MKTIYYTITDQDTGLFLESGAVLNINAPNTLSGQAPTPTHGKEAIEQRLGEMRPGAQLMLLDKADFWRKVSEDRPQPTYNDLVLLGRGSSYAEEPFSEDDF